MPDGVATTILPAGDPESLAAAVAALTAGHIVGMPTETVYGIGVVPRADSLARLVDAKRRPTEKGIALLIDELDQVDHVVVLGTAARRLADRFWPGPLTLVLPVRRGALVPDLLTGGRAQLGVRMPGHHVPRSLAREVGPIAVTSANLSGKPAALDALQLAHTLGDVLAVVIDDGPARGGVPSTVVIVDGDAVEVSREGALSRETILLALAEG